jgi:hypothetical protein
MGSKKVEEGRCYREGEGEKGIERKKRKNSMWRKEEK